MNKGINHILLVFILMLMTTLLSHAEIKFGETCEIVFASMDEARDVLTQRDDYVQRMSPFDRAARMKTNRDVSEKEYLEFVGSHVRDWNENERQNMTVAIQAVQKDLEPYSHLFPPKVFIIKTTGKEEGGAAYTRSNAVVFPESFLKKAPARIKKILCHELFHILSRANPELREKFYSAIGFEKCEEVEFPSHLKARKITNPDAPRNDHCIHLQVEGQECWGIPILYSNSERYDILKGGEFFNYLQFQFLLVDRKEDSLTVKPLYEGTNPRLIDISHASGFYEQVGRNTQYIIHPEEILADNFALLVLASENVQSPEILEKMKNILNKKGVTESSGLMD